MFTFSDVSRCPGTFLFFSSSLGRSFHFSGTAPFLKVHRFPPGTRNMSSARKWTLQTTVALVIRKPSFPDFLAARFSQIRRSFSFFGNVKSLKRVFFPCRIVHSIRATKKRVLVFLILFLCVFHHLETLYILSLVFIQTGNRKSELCKASVNLVMIDHR